MRKYVISIFLGFFLLPRVGGASELNLDSAILNVQNACAPISESLNKMKTRAGINTAITGVGTGAGAAAATTGFIKSGKDKDINEVQIKLEKLRAINSSNNSNPTPEQIMAEFKDYKSNAISSISEIEAEIKKLESQSKNLGNWRTGLIAGAAATNVAGAVISSTNKVDEDLAGAIKDCINAVDELNDVKMQARINGTDISNADKITSACGKFEYIDSKKINDLSKSAMWSSVAGAATGTAGTITSGMANSDKTRNNNSASGVKSEKNLNTASNVLSVGTGLASGVATIFNASQIKTLKEASEIADNCSEALK